MFQPPSNPQFQPVPTPCQSPFQPCSNPCSSISPYPYRVGSRPWGAAPPSRGGEGRSVGPVHQGTRAFTRILCKHSFSLLMRAREAAETGGHLPMQATPISGPEPLLNSHRDAASKGGRGLLPVFFNCRCTRKLSERVRRRYPLSDRPSPAGGRPRGGRDKPCGPVDPLGAHIRNSAKGAGGMIGHLDRISLDPLRPFLVLNRDKKSFAL